MEPLESLWYKSLRWSLCNFGNGNLRFRPFQQKYIMFSNPIRGEKRRNVMFSFGALAQMPRLGQKLTCVPKKNTALILWITVQGDYLIVKFFGF